MIGIITAATQSGSILGYDLGDKKNKDQRIRILGTEGVLIDVRDIIELNKNWKDEVSKKDFKKLSRKIANDLAEQFDDQASVNDRIKKTTGHIALSFSPGDREKLKDASLKVRIAKEYMQMMGIEDTQWVLVEHFDTNAPHLHIAYNRVKFDGTVISGKNERYRSQKISKELSSKYKLTPPGKAERKTNSLSKKRQEYSHLREMVLEILKYSLSFSEFEEDLAAKNIFIRKKKHAVTGKIYGLSYSIGNDEIFAKASKLDREKLTYKGVLECIKINKEKFREAYSDLPPAGEYTKKKLEKKITLKMRQ